MTVTSSSSSSSSVSYQHCVSSPQAFTAASQGFFNSLVYGWTHTRFRHVRAVLCRDVDTQTPLLRCQKKTGYQTLLRSCRWSQQLQPDADQDVDDLEVPGCFQSSAGRLRFCFRQHGDSHLSSWSTEAKKKRKKKWRGSSQREEERRLKQDVKNLQLLFFLSREINWMFYFWKHEFWNFPPFEQMCRFE